MGKKYKVLKIRKRQMTIALINIVTLLLLAVYSLYIRIVNGYNQEYILGMIAIILVVIILLIDFAILFIETDKEIRMVERRCQKNK